MKKNTTKLFDALTVTSTTTYYSKGIVNGVAGIQGTSASGGTDVTEDDLITLVIDLSAGSGTLYIEACNLQEKQLDASNSWGASSFAAYDNLVDAGTPVTSIAITGGTKKLVELADFGFARLRLRYVNATGTDNVLTVTAGKGA